MLKADETHFHFPVDFDTFKEIIKHEKRCEYYADFYYDIPNEFKLMKKNWWLIGKICSNFVLHYYLRKSEYNTNDQSISYTVEYDSKKILKDLELDENRSLNALYLREE